MLGLVFVVLFAVLAYWYQQTEQQVSNEFSQKVSSKLDQLWEIAQQSLRERKYLRAEKALLTILRVDERNATAYNRLGILYAKQQAFKDAIECFEIAQSLEPSASSLHNVGLIYYETGDYEKAELAFKQALSMDEAHAARHIAYAKVLEKLGRTKHVIASLERAVEIDPSPQAYKILADVYERNNRPSDAEAARRSVQELLSQHQAPRVQQVRKA